MMAQTAPVSREALRAFREQKGLSQRELGRRVAKRLGEPTAIRALQVRLARIEKGDEISAHDRDFVDALAEELALGEKDIGVPPKWIWVGMTSGRPSFLALAGEMLVFSSPEKAYATRDALAHLTHGRVKPMQGAHLFAIHEQGLHRTLEVNFGAELDERKRNRLVAVDPDEITLFRLNLLQLMAEDEDAALVFEGDAAEMYGERVQLREDVAHAAFEDRDFEFALIEKHELALLHLKSAPPYAPPHLLEQWKREEQAYFDVLTRVQELRRAEREDVLRGETN